MIDAPLNDEAVVQAEKSASRKTALCAVDLATKLVMGMVGSEISLRTDNPEELMGTLICAELNLG